MMTAKSKVTLRRTTQEVDEGALTLVLGRSLHTGLGGVREEAEGSNASAKCSDRSSDRTNPPPTPRTTCAPTTAACELSPPRKRMSRPNATMNRQTPKTMLPIV